MMVTEMETENRDGDDVEEMDVRWIDIEVMVTMEVETVKLVGKENATVASTLPWPLSSITQGPGACAS